MGKLALDGQLSQLRLHRDSSLLATALEDFNILLVVIDTRSVQIELTGRPPNHNCLRLKI